VSVLYLGRKLPGGLQPVPWMPCPDSWKHKACMVLGGLQARCCEEDATSLPVPTMREGVRARNHSALPTQTVLQR
jgi:hypothetical protein